MSYNPIAHKHRPACSCLDLSADELARILAAMNLAGDDAYRGSIESVAGPMLDAALAELQRLNA